MAHLKFNLLPADLRTIWITS